MDSREHTVWIWVAAAVAAGIAAWAVYGPISAPSETGPTSAPVTLRANSPGPAAADNAPSAPLVTPLAERDRFKMVGVMTSGRERSVLITVDGKPARMFRIGETVDGNIVVRDVSARGASLGPREGGSVLALEMQQAPPLAPVAAPAPTALAVPQPPLADGSVQSQEVLRKIGAKYAPISSPTEPAPKKPMDGTVPIDDGRWKPPGQQ